MQAKEQQTHSTIASDVMKKRKGEMSRVVTEIVR